MEEKGFSYQEAQKSLIQSLFNEQSLIPKISSYIKVDDFADENYRAIYTSLIALSNTESQEKFSIWEVYNWTIKNNLSVNPDVISQLSIPTTESPSVLADIVKRLSIQYQARNLISETANKLNYDSPETLEIISEAETRLNHLSSSLILKDEDKNFAEDINDFKDIILSDEIEQVKRVPLYNKILNDTLDQGWKEEQLIVIGARTGVGKSVFAVDSAVEACNDGKSVLFFSLEMSKKQLYGRMLAVEADVILNKLKPGVPKADSEIERIKEATNRMINWKLEIDDTPGVSVENIVAKSKLKALSTTGLDMIIIDYLQLITPSSLLSRKTRQEQVAELSRQMKLLAKTLKVPVMVLVQLNRVQKSKDDQNIDELPTKDEIRESGAIAQDADVVILIHRKFKEDETDPKATFIVDKNRGGQAPRTFKVRCVLEKSAFKDLEKEEQEEELAIESAKDSFDFIDSMGLEDNAKNSNETSLWESNVFQEDNNSDIENTESVWDNLFD